MRIEIHPETPQLRKVRQVVDVLESGGIIIYPTDTVYGLGCDIYNQKAVDKICHLRGLDPKKAMLSFICRDISQISSFTPPLDNTVFKLLKKNLPGPFTFVLKSNSTVPKLFKNRKRTIGVRIPEHPVPLAIVEMLGRPILTTSLKSDDEIAEYFTDPLDFYDDFRKLVDLTVDAGAGKNIPSTVVDCTLDKPEVIRMGAGVLTV